MYAQLQEQALDPKSAVAAFIDGHVSFTARFLGSFRAAPAALPACGPYEYD